jgi:hypothetical protein
MPARRAARAERESFPLPGGPRGARRAERASANRSPLLLGPRGALGASGYHLFHASTEAARNALQFAADHVTFGSSLSR